jgi:hypothetical protein
MSKLCLTCVESGKDAASPKDEPLLRKTICNRSHSFYLKASISS